jgi:hypothetical protein
MGSKPMQTHSKRVTSDRASVEHEPPSMRSRRARVRLEANDVDAERFIVLDVDEIDAEDLTYSFRVSLESDVLLEDIGTNGQDVPVIVRRVEGRSRFQLVLK